MVNNFYGRKEISWRNRRINKELLFHIYRSLLSENYVIVDKFLSTVSKEIWLQFEYAHVTLQEKTIPLVPVQHETFVGTYVDTGRTLEDCRLPRRPWCPALHNETFRIVWLKEKSTLEHIGQGSRVELKSTTWVVRETTKRTLSHDTGRIPNLGLICFCVKWTPPFRHLPLRDEHK